MNDTEMEKTRQTLKALGDGYVVPAPLMHRIMVAVLSSIIIIGGYMVMWAYNDAAFKSRMLTEMQFLKDRVVEIGEDQDEHEADHDYQSSRRGG